MKDEENLAMIVKFVKYLIDKDVLDKQYEEDSIWADNYAGKDSSICCFVLYCLYSKKTYRRNHLYCFLYGCKADYRWFSCKKFFGMSDRISINIINGIRNNCSVNRKV